MSAEAPFSRRRGIRFVIVGTGAAGLLFALSWLFVRIGLSPFVGSAAAYAIAFLVAYTAQQRWTFGGSQPHGRALPRYLTVQLGCAVISGVVAHVAVEALGASPLVMSIVVTIAASAASFVLSSLWVFAARR